MHWTSPYSLLPSIVWAKRSLHLQWKFAYLNIFGKECSNWMMGFSDFPFDLRYGLWAYLRTIPLCNPLICAVMVQTLSRKGAARHLAVTSRQAPINTSTGSSTSGVDISSSVSSRSADLLQLYAAAPQQQQQVTSVGLKMWSSWEWMIR